MAPQSRRALLLLLEKYSVKILIKATRLSIMFAGILLSGLASAQDTDDLAKAAEDEHREHEANEIAVFIGLTHERRENGAALGLEYERRIDASLGIGVLAERTWGDFDFWVFAIPLTLHADRWKIVLAPGFEESGGRTEKLVRVAVGYEFETSKAKVTPSLSVDFVDGEAVFVLGVAFGRGF